MMHITYLVHSTSTDNEQRRRSGWNDPHLSECGISQAHDQATRFANLHVDAILASDLTRTMQTAATVFANRLVIPEPRLRELNYGQFNGHPEAEFKHEVGWEISNRYPDGEHCMDVQARITSLLAELHAADFSHVVFVAHKYPQLALEVLCNNLTWHEALTSDWRLVGQWQPCWEYEYKGHRT